MTFLTEFVEAPLFRQLSETVRESGMEAYVVGGYVRDRLLGLECKDVDIVVVGNGIEFARRFAEKTGKKATVKVYKNFGTAMVKFRNGEDWTVEFVGARKESYRANSRKPIVEDGTLEDDLQRRDFTINAFVINLHPDYFGAFSDPFHGLTDLDNRLIRTPNDPHLTFSDDPLRMLRAVRFATQLDFRIEENTFKAIAPNVHRLKIVSKERIIDEINKIMMAPVPSIGFKLLEKSGILAKVFPQLQELKGVETRNGKSHKDNFYHTLQVLDNLSAKTDNLWLRWAALLHDIAKPATKRFDPETGWTFHGHEFIGAKMIPSIFKSLKLPLDDRMKYVQKLVLLHLRPIVLSEEYVTDSAVRRLLFEAGDDIDDLMLLCEADITSKNPEKVRRYLANFRIVREKLVEIEEKDKLRNWQPPVSGETIMKTFGLKPSKMVGVIKTAIREAILEGVIPNDAEAAYRFMLEEGARHGLKPVKDEQEKN
ncbi:MAG: HD domain-containing protein [Bacteroidales bacterium]